MGASMAERLLAPDIRLHVFDTRQEAMEPFVKRSATACASPALVANSAEIICIPYVGFPRVLNALTLVKEVMAERGLSPESPAD